MHRNTFFVAAATALLLLLASISAADAKYILGRTGANCVETCYQAGLNCNPTMQTNNSAAIFAEAGAMCKSLDKAIWWASDQPSFNTSNGICLGFIDVPAAVACQGRYPTTQRVCNCDAPRATLMPIGTAISQYLIGPTELPLFAHVLDSADPSKFQAALNHFWMTPTSVAEGITVRYYVDGETTPSIEFRPGFAAGAAWAESADKADAIPLYSAGGFFSKKAHTGAFNWNLPVPFSSKILVTLQAVKVDVLYAIVRGRQNARLTIPGIDLRSYEETGVFSGKWRLVQQQVNRVFQPLEFVTIVNMSKGTRGFVFGFDLGFTSQNMNILEGCFHMREPGQQRFAGTLASSGGEDLFSSAYYFDGGKFQFAGSGLVQSQKLANGSIAMSMYKVFASHEPYLFDNGQLFEWRNGDSTDRSGIKCLNIHGPNTNGHPSASHIVAYSWVYQSI